MQTAQQAIRSMRILLVEPEDTTRYMISMKLAQEGFELVQACSLAHDAEVILTDAVKQQSQIDLLILGIPLDDHKNLAVLEAFAHTYNIASMVIGQPHQRTLAIEALSRGACDYMLYPVDPCIFLLKIEKLLTKRFMRRELRRSTTRNEMLFLNVLSVMAKMIEAKDPYTRFHSEQVSALAVQIARKMNREDEEVRRIGVAGILHDLGKMGIREAILLKPGSLDEQEWQIVKRHPVIASTILEPIEQIRGALSYIKHHHERLDGNGYPDGLKGEQIPLGARIIHAAEAFDTMVSPRVYCPARDSASALKELRRCCGTQFDPEVVDALTQVTAQTKVLPRVPTGQNTLILRNFLQELTSTISVRKD